MGVSALTSECVHKDKCPTEVLSRSNGALLDEELHLSRYNCSLPELGSDGKEIPGKYGELCEPWDEVAWAPAMRSLAPLVRANSPSGVAGNNFMYALLPIVIVTVSHSSSRLSFCELLLVGAAFTHVWCVTNHCWESTPVLHCFTSSVQCCMVFSVSRSLLWY